MSMSLNDRFSSLAPARVPPKQQTVQVNLGGVSTRQPTGGRTVVKAARQQPQQQQQRTTIKKVGVNGSAARAGRRAQTQDRVVSKREQAIAQRRAAPQAKLPALIQSSVPKLTAPFQLAPVFTQQPAFTLGTKRQAGGGASTKKKGTQQQQPKQQQGNKPAAKKQAGGNTQKKSQGNAPPKRQANGNGRQTTGRGGKTTGNRQPKAQQANGQAPAKKQGGAARGGKTGGRGGAQSATPATQADLDKDLDTYMSDKPQ